MNFAVQVAVSDLKSQIAMWQMLASDRGPKELAEMGVFQKIEETSLNIQEWMTRPGFDPYVPQMVTLPELLLQCTKIDTRTHLTKVASLVDALLQSILRINGSLPGNGKLPAVVKSGIQKPQDEKKIAQDSLSTEAPTDLIDAIFGNNESLVRELLSKSRADLEYKVNGMTPLMHAVVIRRSPSIVELLTRAGANLDVRFFNGDTLLLRAVRLNQKACVKVLVDSGVDLHAKDQAGQTAYELARDKEYDAICPILLDAGAVDENGHTGLMSAIFEDNVGRVNRILRGQTDLFVQDPEGNNAFHIAAKCDEVREKPIFMELLLQKRKAPKGKNCDGHAPLYYVTRPEMILQMILKGAEDDDGDSGLMLAVKKNDLAIVDLLLPKFLVVKDDIVTIKDPGIFQKVFERAVKMDRLECVKKIANASPISLSMDWATQLLPWAIQNGSNPMVALLISMQAKVNAQVDGRFPLELAVAHSKAESVQLLLKRGAKVTDYDGPIEKNLISQALEKKQYNITRFLLQALLAESIGCTREEILIYLLLQAKQSGDDMLAQSINGKFHVDVGDQYGKTLLHRAIIRKDDHKAEALVNLGATLDLIDANGSSALMLACQYGCFKTALMLIDKGVDVNVRNLQGDNALLLLVQIGESTPELVRCLEALLRAKAQLESTDNDGETPLFKAVKAMNARLVHTLLRLGAQPLARNRSGNLPIAYVELQRTLFTPQMKVVKSSLDPSDEEVGAREIPEMLLAASCINTEHRELLLPWIVLYRPEEAAALTRQGIKLDAQDHEGNTALMRALELHNDALAELLLSSKANINIKNKKGRTALMRAVERGDVAAVQLLRKFPLDLEVSENESGFTAFLIAVKCLNMTMMQLLLDMGSNINAADHTGMTALMHLSEEVIEDTALPFVELLLERKANLDCREKNMGNTALIFAAQATNTKIVNRLLQFGADLNVHNLLGDKANIYLKAPMVKLIEMNRLLRLAKGYSLLMRCIIAEDVNVSLELIGEGNLDAQDDDGNTALMHALRTKQYQIVQKLVSAKANLNLKNKKGQTALMLEVNDLTFKYVGVSMLIQAKADLNVQDPQGNTALSLAIEARAFGLARLLIQAGANVNTRNNWGLSAYDQTQRDIYQHNVVLQGVDLYLRGLYLGNGGMRDIELLLLSTGAVDELGNSLLMRHIEEGKNEHALSLITKGTDLSVVNKLGNSAVHTAAISGNLKALKALQNAGADFTLVNYYGRTPIMEAALNNKQESVKFLLEPIYKYYTQDRDFVLCEALSVGMDALIENLLLAELSNKSLILIVPYLLHSQRLAELALKNLNPEEIQAGLETIQKMYPKSALTWVKEASLEINPVHLSRHVKDIEIPPAPKDISIEILKIQLKNVNTTDLKKPGYRNPDTIWAGYKKISLKQLHAGLDRFIYRVTNKTPFLGTPPAKDPEALKEFYDEIETLLKHIAFKIQEPQLDPDISASALFDLAVAGLYCGQRYKSEPLAVYKLLYYGTIKELTFEEQVYKLLQDFRSGIIDILAHRQFTEEGRLLPYNPHHYNQIVLLIGKKAGVVGAKHSEKEGGLEDEIQAKTNADTNTTAAALKADPGFSLPHLTESGVFQSFLEHYVATAIIDRLDAAINGALGPDKRRVKGTRELKFDQVIAWFSANIPDDWKPEYEKMKKEALALPSEAVNAYLEKHEIPIVKDPKNSDQILTTINMHRVVVFLQETIYEESLVDIRRSAIIQMLRAMKILG